MQLCPDAKSLKQRPELHDMKNLAAFCQILFLAPSLCAGENDPRACADGADSHNLFLQLAVQLGEEIPELQKLVSLLLLIRKDRRQGLKD